MADPGAAPAAVRTSRRPWYRALQASAAVLLRASADVRIDGLDNFPTAGPYLIAINHLHALDLIVAFTALPHEVAGLAWVGLAGHPIYGPVMRRVGHAIFVQNESDHRAMAEAVRWLRAGGVVLVAPEGTRSPGGALQRGRPGVAYLASRTGAAVVPLAAWGHERLAADLRHLRRGRVRARVGRPFVLDGTPNRARSDVLEAYTDTIMWSLSELLPEAYRGAYGERGDGRTAS